MSVIFDMDFVLHIEKKLCKRNLYFLSRVTFPDIIICTYISLSLIWVSVAHWKNTVNTNLYLYCECMGGIHISLRISFFILRHYCTLVQLSSALTSVCGYQHRTALERVITWSHLELQPNNNDCIFFAQIWNSGPPRGEFTGNIPQFCSKIGAQHVNSRLSSRCYH